MVSAEGRNFYRVFQVGDIAGNRAPRSSYVPFGVGVENGAHERQEVVRVRSATEECEDETTEAPQYYEYGEDMRRGRPVSRLFPLSFSTNNR